MRGRGAVRGGWLAAALQFIHRWLSEEARGGLGLGAAGRQAHTLAVAATTSNCSGCQEGAEGARGHARTQPHRQQCPMCTGPQTTPTASLCARGW